MRLAPMPLLRNPFPVVFGLENLPEILELRLDSTRTKGKKSTQRLACFGISFLPKIQQNVNLMLEVAI
jgi:hypothetical protein